MFEQHLQALRTAIEGGSQAQSLEALAKLEDALSPKDVTSTQATTNYETWRALRRARVYVSEASTRYYDGVGGDLHRQAAWTLMSQIDVVLAALIDKKPVRIYDYVWRQTEDHLAECIYACSYTPEGPLKAGKLLAVVDPTQIPESYLQRGSGL